MSPPPQPIHTLLLPGALLLVPRGDVVRTAHPESARVPVSPELPGDSLWLSMALPALGLDPWSLLGLFLFQLLQLLLPTTTAGGGGQGPMPRVRYYAGKCMMAASVGMAIESWRWVEEGERNRGEGGNGHGETGTQREMPGRNRGFRRKRHSQK